MCVHACDLSWLRLGINCSVKIPLGVPVSLSLCPFLEKKKMIKIQTVLYSTLKTLEKCLNDFKHGLPGLVLPFSETTVVTLKKGTFEVG